MTCSGREFLSHQVITTDLNSNKATTIRRRHAFSDQIIAGERCRLAESTHAIGATNNRIKRLSPSKGSRGLKLLLQMGRRPSPKQQRWRRKPSLRRRSLSIVRPWPATRFTCQIDECHVPETPKMMRSHRIFQGCMTHKFEQFVQDHSQTPPQCCENASIPLRYVEQLFDDEFKRRWNRKYTRYIAASHANSPKAKQN